MKTVKANLTLLLMGVLIFSCRKNGVENTIGNSFKEKVSQWMDKQQNPQQVKSAAILNGIKANLEMEKAWTNNYENGETILTIPINKNYEFKNNIGKNPQNYMVLFQDVNNNIRSGYVWQVLPETTITKNSIANIYNHVDEDLNGTYVLLSLKDNFILQYKYENNKMKESMLRQSKPSSTSVNSGSLVCNDYYVLRTNYNVFTGEVLNQEVLYSFQVCNCLPSNMVQTTITATSECDPIGGGGGGGSIEQTVTKNVNWVVGQNSLGAWLVRSYERLDGIKMPVQPDGTGSHFTSINHVGEFMETVNGCINPNPSPNTPPYLPWAIWNKYSSNASLSGTISASSVVTGQVSFCDNGPRKTCGGFRNFFFDVEFP